MSLLDDSVSDALSASRIVGKKNSYASDNPAESAAVFSYMRGGTRPSVATAMGRHLVALEDARRAGYAPPAAPTPPAAAAPLWDGRASAYTAIPAQGDSVPAGMGCIFVNQDITIVPDTRWGKAFKTVLSVTSKNPWWVGETANSAELVSQPKRPLAIGQVDWFAQSFLLPAYLDTVSGWTIVSQFGYPTLTSPPGSIIIVGSRHWSNTSGVPQLGFEHHAGEIANVGDKPAVNVLNNYRPVSTLIGKWVDVVVGLKWTLDDTGWAVFATRVDGGAWTQHETYTGPTAEKLASEPLPLRDVMDKQGGYQSDPLPTWPSGWTQTILLRGLTRHAARDEAEASLA